MPHHRVEAVANLFINRARNEGLTLTNMKLQKLPYIAHGWGLVLNQNELVNVQPYAWPYGPVYPSLYNNLKKYGASEVTDFIHEHDDNPFMDDRGQVIHSDVDFAEENLVGAVWNAYKNHSAYELSALTHQPDSPWTITYSQTPNGVIPNDLIRRHFLELADRRRHRG